MYILIQINFANLRRLACSFICHPECNQGDPMWCIALDLLTSLFSSNLVSLFPLPFLLLFILRYNISKYHNMSKYIKVWSEIHIKKLISRVRCNEVSQFPLQSFNSGRNTKLSKTYQHHPSRIPSSPDLDRRIIQKWRH